MADFPTRGAFETWYGQRNRGPFLDESPLSEKTNLLTRHRHYDVADLAVGSLAGLHELAQHYRNPQLIAPRVMAVAGAPVQYDTYSLKQLVEAKRRWEAATPERIQAPVLSVISREGEQGLFVRTDFQVVGQQRGAEVLDVLV
jgi:hypothetical protein